MSRPLDARERAEVLGIGARLLQAKYPTRRDIQFYAGIFEAGGVGVRFLARFDWHGLHLTPGATNSTPPAPYLVTLQPVRHTA